MYLSIDLGTTGCRSILFDDHLCELASAYEEYGLITPKEKWSEQDAELWWKLTVVTAQRAIEKGKIDPKQIDSISVSSQGITIVPVDKNIKPLCNALSWLDIRAEEETKQIEKDFGNSKIFSLTGKPIAADYTLPKIMWIKKNMPDIYQRAYKFLMPLDFLIARFSGCFVTDHSMASGTLMYDIKNKCWSSEILQQYGIDEHSLPEISCSGKSVGTVLPEVAEVLGLRKDCVIALGAQDQKCAAYGVGLSEGIMTISLGTAAAVTKLWHEAKTELNTGVGWCGYVEENSFVTEGVVATAGTCFRWVRDLLFKGESYATMNQEAEEVLSKNHKNPLVFYPYMNGPTSPDFYPESTGVFYGVNLASVRGDFALAVMEGISFQIRILLENMQAYGEIHTLILFGGAANSELWCQILADITGMKINVPTSPEAASAGAARLAALAVGEKIEPIPVAKSYYPSEKRERYNQRYKKYRLVEKKLWEE